jgi:D-glycero-D-manno-heptose 1,7-bisphosphate phosphatase
VKLVILDRDGVINQDSDDYIRGPDEFVPLPGSLEAILRLKQAGYRVAVATNQSGIARGYFTEDALAAMHARLRELLREQASGDSASERPLENDERFIDRIVYCPHAPGDNCACRKPRPGMLLTLLREFAVPASEAIFIGDTISDIEAARAAGVPAALVRSGKGQRTLRNSADRLGEIPVYADLAEAVEHLLSAPRSASL